LVLDGREGRPANAPKLTPEYLAKWEVIRKSRMAGSPEFDPNVRCVSAGMPNMMSMTYGMEVQHTKNKITMYGELNDVYRRIFLDGRKPPQRVLDDPTFAGYSTESPDLSVMVRIGLHTGNVYEERGDFLGRTVIVAARITGRAEAAERKKAPDAERVRDDWGAGSLEAELTVDSDRANLAGVTNLDIARSSAGSLDGLPVGQLREHDHLIPIVLRLRAAERARLSDIANLYVQGSIAEGISAK